jgi:phthiocerol/phenolphthiocerol synthesis type-I polyketide synthase E
MSGDGSIAVVGAGCRLPGAGDVASFWRNLRAGADTITRFESGELVEAGVPSDLVRHPDYVGARGVLDGGDRFAYRHFGYSAGEAAAIDPQQRVFLEVSFAALGDAGIDPARFPGWIGVFGGSDTSGVGVDFDDPEVMSKVIGTDKDFLATRVAYKLGLRGPALTVQTACSTSLVAVHQACQSLLTFECDAAIAGGVSLRLPQTAGYLFHEGHILSVDGRCRPFDADSGGTVSSNGAAAVVLRRLEDALDDGDPVMAVVRASAINNDGSDKVGYTAPSPAGQRDVILLAMGKAGVDADDVVHVEAHGTATQLGDPVEVTALTDAFRESTTRDGYCWLSSVKGNIGHTGAAAGVAGFVKTALLLQHREVVPNAHFRRPNPRLQLETTPFRVSTDRVALDADRPLVASVSSFGVGGTNAHAVLETPPQRDRGGRAPGIYCLSAPSAGTLDEAKAALADRLDAEPDLDASSVAWTLTGGRPALTHRVALPASDLTELREALRSEQVAGVAADRPVRAGLVLPGQGALYAGAASAAHALLPVFRTLFDAGAEHCRRAWGTDLAFVVDARADQAHARASLTQQLGLLLVGYALGKQVLEWGVEPAGLLGHSGGEYTAAALAGAWSLTDGLDLVGERALAMDETGPGSMLAVYAPLDDVSALLDHHGVGLATDGPGQLVVSGPSAAIDALQAALTDGGIDTSDLDAGHAYHSDAIRPAGARLAAKVRATPPGALAYPVVSNLTGDWLGSDRLGDEEYWVEHMCNPVRLRDGVATLLGAGTDLVVELGPGQTMSAGVRRHPDLPPGHPVLPLLGREREGREAALLRAVGALWSAGADVDWGDLTDTPRPVRVSLPPVVLDAEPCASPATPAVPRRADADQTRAPDSTSPARVAGSPRQGPPATSSALGHGEDPVAALWCAALGVPSAAATDDFFALAGDSLAMVQLLGKVRNATGARVPLAEFVADPTFGNLVRIVDERRPADEPSERANLLALAAGGNATPLFLAAPATGSALSYRRLAELLDDQPVYGLNAPGLHDGEPVCRTVEELAAAHLRLVKGVQPTGPYRLGGWSTGAVAAHEMARQLTSEGEAVELLLCLDGMAPDTSGKAIFTVPRYLVSSMRLTLRARLDTARNRLLPGRRRGSAELETHYARVHNASLRAVLRYVPQPVRCPVTLLACGPEAGLRRRVERETPGLYPGGVDVRAASGDHFSMLEPGHVEQLARTVQAVLAAPGQPTRTNTSGRPEAL